MNQAIAMNKQPPSTVRSLPDLCGDAGLPLRKAGSRWCSSVCPSDSCGASSKLSSKFSIFVGRDGRWRYKCLGCGIYGDSADFIALAKGVTLGEALYELTGATTSRNGWRRINEHRAAVNDLPKNDKDALGRALAKIKAHAFDTGPRPYLHRRGIENRTIDYAIETGQLRLLPSDPVVARKLLMELVGKDDMIASGLLKPNSNWPAIAFHPIVALEPGSTGAEFRIAEGEKEGTPKAIRYGSMTWPWFFKRNDNPSTIIVVEGIIDSLSVYQGIPEVQGIMGVPGVNGWTPRWLEALYERYPDATLMPGFDSDDAGNQNTEKIGEVAKRIGFKVLNYQPPAQMDWNELLVSRMFL